VAAGPPGRLSRHPPGGWLEDNDSVSGADGELRQLMLRAPFALRARRQARYALAGLGPATLGALFLVVLFGAGLLLTASLVGTFVGLLVLVLALRLARGLGGLHRRLAGRLLHREFPWWSRCRWRSCRSTR
jgi:hypothetical protein